MSNSSHQGPVELPSGPFQRYATRYEPTRRDACLSWWEASAEAEGDSDQGDETGEFEPRHHFALLLDISHTGASIALDQVPEVESDVWLRLEGESITDWSQADVVGVTTTTRGPHLVRLAFRAPCPFETLRAAVCG